MNAPAAGTETLRVSDERAVAILRTLVEIPSVSRDEAACCLALEAQMRLLGFDAWIDESGSAVGVIGDASEGAREVCLLGHIDTVPGNIPVRLEGGVLHGRGTVDAKGSLAAFVCAAARANLPAGVRVRVIGAVQEECATSAGARHAAVEYRPAACIIGEPSGEDGVTIGYKGRLLATLTVRVPMSHSAGPESTAPELACEAWGRVREAAEGLRPASNRVFDRVQARLRAMRSESDGLRDTAELSLGFRLPPGLEPGELERACEESTRDLGAECRWRFSGHEVAHATDRSGSVVRALCAAVRGQGMEPKLKLKTGTSDMNVVAPVWRCPIAAYGPGDSALDHAPDERLHVNEYLRAIRVLTGAIEQLAHEIAPAPGQPSSV
jgi:LysW-gamma-L-lysine carboxypeptidase